MDDGANSYLDIDQLSARSGFSKSTIHRLKKAGKIPYCQPGGKGARLLFPPDAIKPSSDSTEMSTTSDATDEAKQSLPGPPPAWLSS